MLQQAHMGRHGVTTVQLGGHLLCAQVNKSLVNPEIRQQLFFFVVVFILSSYCTFVVIANLQTFYVGLSV